MMIGYRAKPEAKLDAKSGSSCLGRRRMLLPRRVGRAFKALAGVTVLCLFANCSGSVLPPVTSAAATRDTVLTATPSALDFGNVSLGSSSILPVIVANTGSASVIISQATVSGLGFSVSGPSLPLTLVPGQNASFIVTFRPRTAGSATGSLSVVSSAPNSSLSEPLSGIAVSQHFVALFWERSSSNGVTGYNVYRGVVSGGPYTRLNSALVTLTKYKDATVEAGQTYYYVATAVKGGGQESSYSDEASATVPSP